MLYFHMSNSLTGDLSRFFFFFNEPKQLYILSQIQHFVYIK